MKKSELLEELLTSLGIGYGSSETKESSSFRDRFFVEDSAKEFLLSNSFLIKEDDRFALLKPLSIIGSVDKGMRDMRIILIQTHEADEDILTFDTFNSQGGYSTQQPILEKQETGNYRLSKDAKVISNYCFDFLDSTVNLILTKLR